MEEKNNLPLADLYQTPVKLCGVGVGTYLLQPADDVVGTLLVLVLFLPASGCSHTCGLCQAGNGWAGLLRLLCYPRVFFPWGLCGLKCDIRSR